MGGNIWAEMLCRFGYSGIAVFGILLIAGLIGTQWLFLCSPRGLSAPIAFCGAIVAFYIQRNDLHFTLVMVRQVLATFMIASLLSLGAGYVALSLNALRRTDRNTPSETRETGMTDVSVVPPVATPV
jgi:hypothetical protein